MSASRIEWTDETWNPVTGCSKVSDGCKHCYAERMAKRLQAMGVDRYRNAFQVTLHDDLIDRPLRWKKPRRVFVNSMSDLFHDKVPFSFIEKVFETIEQTPQHSYQILTKRSARLMKFAEGRNIPDNAWMGVSVENAAVVDRVRDLQQVKAKIRFLSCEPLIGSVGRLPLKGINWVIVGGESGPGARPMEQEWVENILKRCKAAGVPFFFKQWGGTNKKATGRLLNGRTYDEFPDEGDANVQ